MTQKQIDTSKYSEEQAATLRDAYTGNECYSDEYRETQPAKGIGQFQTALSLLTSDLNSVQDVIDDIEPTETQLASLIKLTTDINALTTHAIEWIEAYGSWYGGNDKLEPLLAKVFDILWARNIHPYFVTNAELDECYFDNDD